MSLSLVTLNHNRESFLSAQIDSIQKVLRQTPEITVEHLVVNVDSTGVDTPTQAPNYTLRNLNISLDRGLLNFSKARNYGAKEAQFENVIFLDADCLVDTNFFAEYVRCLTPEFAGIVHGHAWYMRPEITYAQMQADRGDHTQFYRPGLDARAKQDMALTNSYELFTSIHFGCRRDLFDSLGGFDEEYRGYSCEDTDFGQKLRAQKIPLYMNKAEAFHQYHKASGAPFEKVSEVVRNVNYFQSKWGWLPAQAWLDAFMERDLIAYENGRVVSKAD